LENFELPISGQPSVLLIGRNGSGKTTVRLALEILQKIGRGTNRVGDLVRPKDFTGGRKDVPMRFEIEVELDGEVYEYVIAFELPRGFKDLQVLEERFTVGGTPLYTRKAPPVEPIETGDAPLNFMIDWRLVALPVLQEQSRHDALSVFKQWLRRMLVLAPIPSLILGDSRQRTFEPNVQVTDFAAWLSGLLASTPSAYSKIDKYLKTLIPDLEDIKNPEIGTGFQSLIVQFSADQGSPRTLGHLPVPFEDLSDGEKCFMICAAVLVAKDAYSNMLCFWDEPDNYLSIDEVGHFVMALRRAFQSGGQFIATSHNPEAIRSFSDENTLFLYRKSHLEPTIVRPLGELQVNGDLVDALTRGDVEP
jgi:ABC-type Mn2+/Zn2+ transport system ATPase subunit